MRTVRTTLKCPRCGGNNLDLIESGTWSSLFRARGGAFDRDEGLHEPESIDRLDAKCVGCSHSWKPRGSFQIDHVIQQKK